MKIKAIIENKEVEIDIDDKIMSSIGYVKQARPSNPRTCKCGFDYYDRHSVHNVATCKYKLERWMKDVEAQLISSKQSTNEYRKYLWNKEGGTTQPEFDFLMGVECLQRAMEKMCQIKQIEEGFRTSQRINNYQPSFE